VNPANLDRKLLHELFTKYGNSEAAGKLTGWDSVPEGDRAAAEWAARGAEQIDDYAACRIEKASDIRDLFTKNFYFGCEADDPMNAWGFNDKVNPYGARLKALFGSDIGHFDVPNMREVLGEAYELVDDGIIGTAELRDFLFGYPIEFWTGMNPAFFKGTVIEQQADEALKTATGQKNNAEAVH
jgi:hypothetical protein